MRIWFTALVLGVLLAAGSSFALNDDGENSLGVYFDEGTFEQNCTEYQALETLSMYFVLANCTQATISGFEFAWDFDPPMLTSYVIDDVSLPPGALSIGTNHNFIVGLTAYATAQATVLARIDFRVLTDGLNAYITAGPADPPSIPGHAVIADGANPGLLIPLDFSTVDDVNVIVDPDGWVRPGIGCLGTNGPVATAPTTWSNVKALYR